MPLSTQISNQKLARVLLCGQNFTEGKKYPEQGCLTGVERRMDDRPKWPELEFQLRELWIFSDEGGILCIEYFFNEQMLSKPSTAGILDHVYYPIKSLLLKVSLRAAYTYEALFVRENINKELLNGGRELKLGYKWRMVTIACEEGEPILQPRLVLFSACLPKNLGFN